MDTNTKDMPLGELLTLRETVNSAIEQYEQRQKEAALVQLEETAKTYGFSLSDLMSAEGPAQKRAKAAIKYRHPENPELKWSGRGLQPRWLVAALKDGTRRLEDFKV